MKLGNLFKAVVDIATLPVSIAIDTATMGAKKFTEPNGTLYTEDKIEKIAEELNDLKD